jgi:hypothetical protein
MCDDDGAMINALKYAFPDSEILYCYFHFVQNIFKKFGKSPVYGRVIGFNRDCHYARDENEYLRVWNAFYRTYDDVSEYPEYELVMNYLYEKCCTGTTSGNCQMFLSPSGIKAVNI